jgi:RNA polymerase sigma factor (sigma-70 family)
VAASEDYRMSAVTSWFHTDDASRRRKFAAATADFDALLTAVGSDRDDEAFTALFDHFGPRVQAHMVRNGVPPFTAADVVQDVMETIWRKAHLFDRRKAAAGTWVFRIAQNRRIDIGRRSREISCAIEDFFEIPDPAESGDDTIAAAQREACVHAALQSLPQEQCALVRLAFFEGLSHASIAARTNLPLGTVKSRLRLAFARLERYLLDLGITGV